MPRQFATRNILLGRGELLQFNSCAVPRYLRYLPPGAWYVKVSLPLQLPSPGRFNLNFLVPEHSVALLSSDLHSSQALIETHPSLQLQSPATAKRCPLGAVFGKYLGRSRPQGKLHSRQFGSISHFSGSTLLPAPRKIPSAGLSLLTDFQLTSPQNRRLDSTSLLPSNLPTYLPWAPSPGATAVIRGRPATPVS